MLNSLIVSPAIRLETPVPARLLAPTQNGLERLRRSECARWSPAVLPTWQQALSRGGIGFRLLSTIAPKSPARVTHDLPDGRQLLTHLLLFRERQPARSSLARTGKLAVAPDH